MFCRECGKELNKDAKFCSNCGTATLPAEEKRKPKKLKRLHKILIAGISLALVVAIAVSLIIYNSTAWKRNFKVEYVKYNTNSSKSFDYSNSSYDYKLTNNTQNVYRNVYAVVFVKSKMDFKSDEFEFESYVTSQIREFETVDFKIYKSDIEEEANARGKDTSFSTIEIVGIRWK